MPGQEQLVFLVEGEGDLQAIPTLAKRLLKDCFGPDCELRVGLKSIRVGNLANLAGHHTETWLRFLQLALKIRQRVAGIVLVLDGDTKWTTDLAGNKIRFCPGMAARSLATEARKMGGGGVFSVAIVFACPEFESWLIAGRGGFAGHLKPDIDPPVDVEKIRDAKKWLRLARQDGYRPTIHQLELAKLADLDGMRSLRSFSRFEKTLKLLVKAQANNQRIVTPE